MTPNYYTVGIVGTTATVTGYIAGTIVTTNTYEIPSGSDQSFLADVPLPLNFWQM